MTWPWSLKRRVELPDTYRAGKWKSLWQAIDLETGSIAEKTERVVQEVLQQTIWQQSCGDLQPAGKGAGKGAG